MEINSERKPGKRILMIGAHPDDCEIKAGGTAHILARQGHLVKFLSLSNGEAGHHEKYGPSLVESRKAEALSAAKILGVESEVLDNKDGQLEPNIKLRHQVIAKIREFEADIIITHRTNDYHPDHRYTGTVVQDSIYLVCVPAVVPEVKPLINNPVVLYFEDRFTKPNAFAHDIVVDISKELEVKFDALCEHKSQFFEWLPWIERIEAPKNKTDLKNWLLNSWYTKLDESLKAKLKCKFDADFVDNIEHFEAFEIGELGSSLDKATIQSIFCNVKFK